MRTVSTCASFPAPRTTTLWLPPQSMWSVLPVILCLNGVHSPWAREPSRSSHLSAEQFSGNINSSLGSASLPHLYYSTCLTKNPTVTAFLSSLYSLEASLQGSCLQHCSSDSSGPSPTRIDQTCYLLFDLHHLSCQKDLAWVPAFSLETSSPLGFQNTTSHYLPSSILSLWQFLCLYGNYFWLLSWFFTLDMFGGLLGIIFSYLSGHLHLNVLKKFNPIMCGGGWGLGSSSFPSPLSK